MSKMSRAVLVFVLLSFVCSLAIAVAAMKHALPSGRLLGISALTFWVLVYVVFRYLGRNRKGTPDASLSQPVTTPNSGFLTSAPTLGKFYLLSGGIAILLGTMASRNQAAFFIAGAVTCCIGGYLIASAKKSRRGGPTPPSASGDMGTRHP
jgi:hypothetical protein